MVGSGWVGLGWVGLLFGPQSYSHRSLPARFSPCLSYPAVRGSDAPVALINAQDTSQEEYRLKIRQNMRHWAAKKALTTPVIGDIANAKLVDLHTTIFLNKATEERREERRNHLNSFFDATMDAYVAALQASHTEAQAREVTHIQANFDFFNHSWTEMMEIPAEELEAHYGRYEDFFTSHEITIDDPLGEFIPPEGVDEAPRTPEEFDQPIYENAIEGFADDVYVETPEGEMIGGGDTETPDTVDPADAPGMNAEEDEREV